MIKSDSGKSSNLYECKDCLLNSAEISPDENYISVIRKSEGVLDHTKQKYVILPQNTLLIFYRNGKLYQEIKLNTRKYDWNPSSNNIAIITGPYREEGSYGFKPEDIFVYSIETREAKKLKIEYPVSVYWAKKNILYIKNVKNNVYRYSLELDDLILTGVKDIILSPDGKYYISYPNVTETLTKYELYDTNNNLMKLKSLSPDLGEIKFWLDNYNNYLVFEKKEYSTEYVEKDSNKDNEKIRIRVRKVKNRELKRVKYTIISIDEDKIINITETNGLEVDWKTYRNDIPIEKNNMLLKLSNEIKK
jgi:hypothetical protein